MTEIEPGLFASDSLKSALRCLLSTNSEPVLKTVLYFIWIYSEHCSSIIFTMRFLSENLVELVAPIAQERYPLDYLATDFIDIPPTDVVYYEKCFDGMKGTVNNYYYFTFFRMYCQVPIIWQERC